VNGRPRQFCVIWQNRPEVLYAIAGSSLDRAPCRSVAVITAVHLHLRLEWLAACLALLWLGLELRPDQTPASDMQPASQRASQFPRR